MGTYLVLIDHPTVATTQQKSSLQQALIYLLLTCETQRSTLPSLTGNPLRSDREADRLHPNNQPRRRRKIAPYGKHLDVA
jgi:hypothetical protein